MESLPAELLDQIAASLSTRDSLALMVSCKAAFERMSKPVQYGTPEQLVHAMRWGCLYGDFETVRRAVSLGAPVSILPAAASERYGQRSWKHEGVLTLFLAAKANRLRTVRLLLELGASIEGAPSEWIRPQVLRIMKKLATPRGLDALQDFIEKGIDARVREMHTDQVAWPLIPAILSGASLQLVRILLDKGAEPNQLFTCRDGTPTASPASAAIKSGSVEVLRELVKHGASVACKPGGGLMNAPDYLPIFAAAKIMAADPGMGRMWMRFCLDNGCDINQAVFKRRRWWRAKFQGRPKDAQVVCSTPLLFFLESIDSWEGDRGKGLLDCIPWMLNQGATWLSPRQTPPPRSAIESDPGEVPPVMSPVELLLHRWGFAKLLDDAFFSMVELLVRSGCMQGHTGRFLRIWDYLCYPRPEGPQEVSGWRRLLDVLFSAQSLNLNELLTDLVVDKAQQMPWGLFEYNASGLTGIFRASIDALVAHGADPNALNSRGCTALTAVWSCLMGENALRYIGDHIKCLRDLIVLLVEKGADPKTKYLDMTLAECVQKELVLNMDAHRSLLVSIMYEYHLDEMLPS